MPDIATLLAQDLGHTTQDLTHGGWGGQFGDLGATLTKDQVDALSKAAGGYDLKNAPWVNIPGLGPAGFQIVTAGDPNGTGDNAPSYQLIQQSNVAGRAKAVSQESHDSGLGGLGALILGGIALAAGQPELLVGLGGAEAGLTASEMAALTSEAGAYSAETAALMEQAGGAGGALGGGSFTGSTALGTSLGAEGAGGYATAADQAAAQTALDASASSVAPQGALDTLTQQVTDAASKMLDPTKLAESVGKNALSKMVQNGLSGRNLTDGIDPSLLATGAGAGAVTSGLSSLGSSALQDATGLSSNITSPLSSAAVRSAISGQSPNLSGMVTNGLLNAGTNAATSAATEAGANPYLANFGVKGALNTLQGKTINLKQTAANAITGLGWPTVKSQLGG